MVQAILENTKLVTVGSLVTASGLIIGALWYKKYLKNKPPTKWMKVGEVEDLCIYPVKSFRGIHPGSFDCTPLGARVGFMRDRSFVVIDKDGNFVTGRDYPKMTQLVPTITDTLITFSCPGTPDEVELDMQKIQGERQKVKIWDTLTEGTDCGNEIAKWISKCILGEESGLRVLFCGLEENGKHPNDRVTSYSKMMDVQVQKTDGGFFSDGVSYHLISESSIKELNSRLDGTEVSAMNFRPNFIIKGDLLIPFEEDNWKWVKIGDAVFQCLSPCTRCLFTTVDPGTGEKSEKMEPLASLRREQEFFKCRTTIGRSMIFGQFVPCARYRFIRDSEKRKVLTTPAMGIYLGLRSNGTVSVGDEVFIPQM